MLTCHQATQLVSQQHERPLSRRERWGLKVHLWLCINCRRFTRQLQLLRRALRELGRSEMADQHGPELPPEARQRIRRALTDSSSPPER